MTGSDDSSWASCLPIIDSLHRAVDTAVEPLLEQHAPRLACKKGCSQCCADDLTVFEVEAESLRQHFQELLRHEHPHPVGACAFLDNRGACRVYSHRPYVCRTQGLPLRWLDVDDEDEAVEYRDICELNDGEPRIEHLEPSSCWTLGAVEEKLSSLQNEVTPGEMRRVTLRSLFERSKK